MAGWSKATDRKSGFLSTQVRVLHPPMSKQKRGEATSELGNSYLLSKASYAGGAATQRKVPFGYYPSNAIALFVVLAPLPLGRSNSALLPNFAFPCIRSLRNYGGCSSKLGSGGPAAWKGRNGIWGN